MCSLCALSESARTATGRCWLPNGLVGCSVVNSFLATTLTLTKSRLPMTTGCFGSQYQWLSAPRLARLRWPLPPAEAPRHLPAPLSKPDHGPAERPPPRSYTAYGGGRLQCGGPWLRVRSLNRKAVQERPGLVRGSAVLGSSTSAALCRKRAER